MDDLIIRPGFLPRHPHNAEQGVYPIDAHIVHLMIKVIDHFIEP